jgi:NitT/TauT family transport system ATP-binding protein
MPQSPLARRDDLSHNAAWGTRRTDGAPGERPLELATSQLTHRYGDLLVLENVDLSVREGEVLAVIGPSGCGKSTLLGILGGLVEASSGEVRVSGRKPDGCLNAFTYVFQDFGLLPWRSVEENVSLALEHHRLSGAEREARITDSLRRMNLLDFRKAVPKQLSGGMRQRVGIARALVVSPAILLLDEPMSSLDAQTSDLLIEDFINLWMKERTTAIYVTHNLAEALRIADRVAIFTRRPGRLREIVAVDVAQADRNTPAGKARLTELQGYLWNAMKVEAQTADRELVGA